MKFYCLQVFGRYVMMTVWILNKDDGSDDNEEEET